MIIISKRSNVNTSDGNAVEFKCHAHPNHAVTDEYIGTWTSSRRGVFVHKTSLPRRHDDDDVIIINRNERTHNGMCVFVAKCKQLR